MPIIKPPRPAFIKATCECTIKYEFTQSLLLILQKSSGEQTHEILSTLESIALQMATDFELDLYNTVDTWRWSHWTNRWEQTRWNFKKKKIAVSYPTTDISFYLEFTFSNQANKNNLHFNFYIPIKKIVYSSEKMNEIISEGIILDNTEDLKEMYLKSHKTPKQIKEARVTKKKSRTK